MLKGITVSRDFFDGTLAEEFERLGYPARWKHGERRNLPEKLVKRITDSGGQITIADPSAKESRIQEGAEPAQIDLQAVWDKKYSKAHKTRVMFPEGFRDGTLANECAAAGHPADFGVGEIAELPTSLLEKIKASGGFFDTDPEAIAQQESQQAKHQQKIQQWRERQAVNQAALRERLATTQHNQAILAEREGLYTEYTGATGKAKEAIWQRITELTRSLK